MCPYHVQRKATIVEYVPSSGKNRSKIVIIPYLQAPHVHSNFEGKKVIKGLGLQKCCSSPRVCLLTSSHSTCAWFICRKILTWKSSEANRKIGHLLRNTQNLRWLLCDQTVSFEREFFCGPCRSERETVAGVLFGSFTMVGSRIREGN